VRLAERVPVEGEDHVPGLLQHLVGHPARPAAGEEAVAVVGQGELAVLLGEDLPQPVGVLDGEAGEVDGHARDVLLVDHDPVGLGEGVRHQGMQGLVRRPAEALHEQADVLVCRRPDDGAGDDEVLVVAPPHLRQQLPGGRGLHVEHAEGTPARDEVPGRGVLERIEALPVDRLAVGPPGHQPDGVAEHRERAVAQQVDLHEARVLGGVLLPRDQRKPSAEVCRCV